LRSSFGPPTTPIGELDGAEPERALTGASAQYAREPESNVKASAVADIHLSKRIRSFYERIQQGTTTESIVAFNGV
jgi:hypothetical protein